MISPGSVLQGRYKVMNSLGSGGFSTVYLAEDLRLAGRTVAVKENQDTSPAAIRAFTQEAELLARLQHPNLPRVTDHFTEASGYQNRPLGLVRLRFSSGAVQEERLVAGHNLREWKIFDLATVATTSAPNVQEVWRTGSRHGGTGTIDMLTIDGAPENRGSTLVAMELADTSMQDIGSMDPAINWLGLTVVGLRPGD